MNTIKSSNVVGAHPEVDGVSYCVWAPQCSDVQVAIESPCGKRRVLRLKEWPDGYYRVHDALGRPGDLYKLMLDGGDPLPDPASRSQPHGVHGPSKVVSHEYEWKDSFWKRPPFRDLVIYELHLGTFTPEGTFSGAVRKLPHLQALGINAVELMPIGEFPGNRNWGYDGVSIYAPARVYGTPDDLRAFVGAAHAHGIAVILDVVYNHLGPDGNYLKHYGDAYFHKQHRTPWGESFNFDGEMSSPVRRFFAQNPAYWMQHFHIDGFRLDAVHAIIDTSENHILNEIAECIHELGGYVIGEDERNEAWMVTPHHEGGHGFDAVWADDFHHVVRVSQTGENVSYFRDFKGTLSELVDTLQHGWLFRGQCSEVTGRKRGTPCAHLPPAHFIHCISNHDQAGNRAFGERLNQSITPEGYRTLSMLLCFTPYTPMLFMGQEWAARSPFLFFTDHNEELGPLITEGRRREFAEFPEFNNHEALGTIPDPQAAESFVRSKLNWKEAESPEGVHGMRLYTECLRLRRKDETFRPFSRENWEVTETSFDTGAMRFHGQNRSYLLVFNLGGYHGGRLKTEPIAQLPEGQFWKLILSSEEKRFGGSGLPSFDGSSQSCAFNHAEVILLTAAAFEKSSSEAS